MRLQQRRSIRLRGYDYSREGVYFVTLCCQNREPLFGEIVDGEMQYNTLGNMVIEEWNKTVLIRNEILLDEFVVMPNHIHGILIITKQARASSNVGVTCQVTPTGAEVAKSPRINGPKVGSLGAIIGQFKRITTIRINEQQGTTGAKIWQRDFYDRIIRNEAELNNTRNYIVNNPASWAEDNENPRRSLEHKKGNYPGSRRI